MTQNADLFRVDAEKASIGAALRPSNHLSSDVPPNFCR
jgi:hypothetical protein